MMKKPDACIRIAVAIIAAVAICAGCRSATPPVSFYTLSAIPPAESRPETVAVMGEKLVGIGPALFPDYLERPQIVTRSGVNRLEMSEFNRWAGRLDRDFLKVFAENLTLLLSTQRPAVYPWKLQEDPDYRIELDVHQFEAQAGGPVLLNATWTIRGRDQGREPLHVVRSVISIPLSGPVSGQDYDALVSAYSRAVGELSREVSAALIQLSKKTEMQPLK